MHILPLLAAGLLALGLAAPASAADAPARKTAQVESGLYVTAREAWDLMQRDPSVVLVDVRDPIEVMFTGFATETDIHVPYRIANTAKWNEEKSVFAMEVNPAFADEVETRLRALGADKESTKVIFMCRSGSTRSAPAADLLWERGWKQVYTMVDGFEGKKLKEGPSKGVRAVNGWRNAGLPWSYKLPKDIIYQPAR